jgi:diguanylate cyclase (GGDEF)-like protein
VVAIAFGALLVGVTLFGIDRPEAAVTALEHRVFPARLALIKASSLGDESKQLFVQAMEAPSDQRALLISQSQTISSDGGSAWHKYTGLSFGTRAERKLQQQYDALGNEAQAAGATLFGLADDRASFAYQAALANFEDLLDGRQVIIDDINSRFYAPRVEALLDDAKTGLSDTELWVVIAFALLVAAGLVNFWVLLRGALAEERLFDVRERERAIVERRANLETQLQRGLEMEPNEESTYEVIEAALAEVRKEHPVELLVSDSSRAHFRQVLSTDAQGRGPGCPVTSPMECPAASSGQTRLFLSSLRLDACPFLRSRDGEPRSAACVPVSIAGVTTAVIHTTGPDHQVPSDEEMTELELVARKAGDRVGFLRVLARTETQARIDVLTGLFNRRSVEQQALEVVDKGIPFVVAFADLDHFKNLNDEFGHEMGDRALRLFGRVLRDSVRPSDIPSRYGGEEFVVVLPDCTLADARIVTDRVRASLATAIAIANVPVFTVSIGLAGSEPPEGFAETVARADAALLHAKGAGRDRVVATTDIPTVDDMSRLEVAAPVADA